MNTVDPRLEQAHTLPSYFYTDPKWLDLELKTVFTETWQLACRLEQVSQLGDIFCCDIATEPVIIVRGLDGVLRAFSNVCRHRAGPVAVSGNRKVLRCGYHGWTYTLDGMLQHAPEFEGVEGFDSNTCLPEFAVEVWAGLVFVNLSERPTPFLEYFGEIEDLISLKNMSSMKWVYRKDWYVDCNWKVYIDNYLEGYHIPVVHTGLNRELDYQKYRTETRKYFSIQRAPVRRGEGSRIGAGKSEEAQYFWIYPNLLLNVYPDNFSTNLILPVGHRQTLTIFEWYFEQPEAEETKKELERVVELSDEVQVEDIAICEAVQKGLESKTYSTGRYSVKRENGVHHFHRLYESHLSKSNFAEKLE